MSKTVLLVLSSASEPASVDGVLRVRDVNVASEYVSIASLEGAFDEIKVSCGVPVTNFDVLSSELINCVLFP
jgi:hypothetical protein